jgi:hypothetical protein
MIEEEICQEGIARIILKCDENRSKICVWNESNRLTVQFINRPLKMR